MLILVIFNYLSVILRTSQRRDDQNRKRRDRNLTMALQPMRQKKPFAYDPVKSFVNIVFVGLNCSSLTCLDVRGNRAIL